MEDWRDIFYPDDENIPSYKKLDPKQDFAALAEKVNQTSIDYHQQAGCTAEEAVRIVNYHSHRDIIMIVNMRVPKSTLMNEKVSESQLCPGFINCGSKTPHYCLSRNENSNFFTADNIISARAMTYSEYRNSVYVRPPEKTSNKLIQNPNHQLANEQLELLKSNIGKILNVAMKEKVQKVLAEATSIVQQCSDMANIAHVLQITNTLLTTKPTDPNYKQLVSEYTSAANKAEGNPFSGWGLLGIAMMALGTCLALIGALVLVGTMGASLPASAAVAGSGALLAAAGGYLFHKTPRTGFSMDMMGVVSEEQHAGLK
jgi:hypothetical protein